MEIYKPAEDSYLLEEQVKKFAKNKSVLDMGSGSGILALAAKKAKAKSILTADINPESVKHLKSKNFNAIKSNLFSKINKKFDLIIFNPPYLPEDKREPIDSKFATTGGKKGDEIILRFLKHAPNYLNPQGKILMAISSLTPRKKILQLLTKLKFQHKTLAIKKLFFEVLEVWEIAKD